MYGAFIVFDYKEHENECGKIRLDDGELLYINEYLLREEPITMDVGAARPDIFKKIDCK